MRLRCEVVGGCISPCGPLERGVGGVTGGLSREGRRASMKRRGGLSSSLAVRCKSYVEDTRKNFNVA